MNEHEMTDLLERATRDLVPDVETLVAGGLRRGRVRQRRRRVAGAVGAVATAALVVGAGWQLLGGDGVVDRGIDPADSAPPQVGPSGGSSTPATPNPSSPAPTGPARLAVTTARVPPTFASLEPGEVSAPSGGSGPDAAPVVDFTWNGLGIRVGLTPDDYAYESGAAVPGPAGRCAEESESGGAACRPGPDGTVVSTSSSTNPEVDGGTEVRTAHVFRPDGWDVLVMAYNGPGKEGPVTASEPPFDLGELREIAASDVWFR